MYRLLAIVLLLSSPAYADETCPGDCDGNRHVYTPELVTGINIALASAPMSRCPALDADNSGAADISEVVAAVGAAVYGCDGEIPTRTVTVTRTRTPTATVTPTASETATVRATATPTRTRPFTATRVPTRTETPIPATGTPKPPPKCPFRFTDTVELEDDPCFFEGDINLRCGGQWGASWISDGELVIGVTSGAGHLIYWGATVTNAGSADLVGYAREADFSDLVEESGSMQMYNGRAAFAVVPDRVPFRIDDCDFLSFIGEYVGQLSEASAAMSVEPPSFAGLRAALKGRAVLGRDAASEPLRKRYELLRSGLNATQLNTGPGRYHGFPW